MRLTGPLDLRPPEGVLWIARKLADAGHQAWAVGGAVRDALLEQRHGDWDLATDATPDRMRALFQRTVPLGIEHGTVGILAPDGAMYETTTFRRDVETFGRHAVVAFAETLEEDLGRRDFTINALAWDPLTGELRDPYRGAADLRAGRLRTVGVPGERFAEDWLRVLRALRFAGHYGLTVEEGTWAALVAAAPELPTLSAERVREELWKVLGKTPRASVALELYARAGVLDALYPALAATVGFLPQEEDTQDVWTTAIRAVDTLPVTREVVRVAALFHGVGMPAARSRDLRGGWRYVGHELLGGRKTEEAMRRLRASNADAERVAWLVARQSDIFPPDAPPAGIRRWLRDMTPERVNDLFRLRFALWRARPTPRGDRELSERWRAAHRVLLEHPPLDVGGLAISGRELRTLGMSPGPDMGQLLRGLLEEVLDDPALNEAERLRERARQVLEENGS